MLWTGRVRRRVVQSIAKAPSEHSHVQSVEGDLATKHVTVTYARDGINEDDLHQSINKAGHMVGACCDTA